MHSITFTFLCVVFASVYCHDDNNGEYYWRPWTSGAPPSDAITLRDYRGVSYIIEAYVPKYGIFVGQAFANQNEVNVTVSNINSTSTYSVQRSQFLKVLCTQSLEKLAWYPTNYLNIQNEMVTAMIDPVLGGVNVNDELIYIAKIIEGQKTVTVGNAFRNYIFYHSSGKAYSQSYYEILVVNGKCKN